MLDKKIKECYENFGTIGANKTDIKFYNLDSISVDNIVNYANKRGYRIKEFSCENKPDFTKLGYDKGYIWIYNPNDNIGSFDTIDYTRKWRYIHEIGHALSYNYILNLFNIESIKRGSGVVSFENAIIALTWEIEAMKIQYKILKDFNIHISDMQKNKEINTLFADLTYRCISGEFSNPDLNNFKPYEKNLLNVWKTLLLDLYTKEGLI